MTEPCCAVMDYLSRLREIRDRIEQLTAEAARLGYVLPPPPLDDDA